MSRSSPVTRDSKVVRPTTDVLLKIARLMTAVWGPANELYRSQPSLALTTPRPTPRIRAFLRPRASSVANTKSAEKAARQAVKHRARNISLRSRSRSAIRDAVETIAKGDKTAAPAAVRKAASSVDSLVNKGLVHKNKASRHKKRLAAKLKKLAGK